MSDRPDCKCGHGFDMHETRGICFFRSGDGKMCSCTDYRPSAPERSQEAGAAKLWRILIEDSGFSDIATRLRAITLGLEMELRQRFADLERRNAELEANAATKILNLQLEISKLQEHQEYLAWNLAGCCTIAERQVPLDYAQDRASPALKAVNELARQVSQAAAMRRELVRIKEVNLNELKYNHELTPEVVIDIKQRIAQLDNVIDGKAGRELLEEMERLKSDKERFEASSAGKFLNQQLEMERLREALRQLSDISNKFREHVLDLVDMFSSTTYNANLGNEVYEAVENAREVLKGRE